MHERSNSRSISLRWLLIILLVICWLIPIAAISVIFGSLLTRSYENAQQQEIENAIQNAFRQLDIRMSAVIEDSKAVSYDGVVRSSYRNYQLDHDDAALYSSVNEYLNLRFSRDEKNKAVFISFRNIDIGSYVVFPGFSEYSVVRNYRNTAEPLIMERMADEDTQIRFFVIDGDLYMARNLLDGKFLPYAAVVMLCNEQVLFGSFENLSGGVVTEIVIDGEVLPWDNAPEPEADYNQTDYSGEIAGHDVRAHSIVKKFRIWRDVASLKYGILAAIALGIPMVLIAAILFYRHITRPTEVLLDATEHVIAGERGFMITEMPSNREFRQLTTRFNAMSGELKNQFEQLFLEQQALQQAKIKTLQSQINPHFLNNTLEVINWEARMAEDEKVSAMIEALSTMLDASLDRDGKDMIPLKQEIGYVDAYLYIIHERLGDRFVAEKDLSPDMDDVLVPRLILQPIVENAVEHDITPQGGGSILIRAFREEEMIILETIHSGTFSPEDRDTVSRILESADAGGGPAVGLQNVAQRMRLIYGKEGKLIVDESDGMIRMSLRFPEIVNG